MMKRVLVLVIAFSLSGCTNYHWEFGGFKPTTLSFDPPEGPPEYQQGFIDGCKSGFSGYANNFNKLFHKWTQDPKLAQNPVYYQIWKDAYGYCANYGMMADIHGLGNWR